jgi:putative ABC transport system permease protein
MILTLALGIGATTAIFSVVYQVLLRPLPYPGQEQLEYLGEWSEQVPGMSVSYPTFLDWRERQRSFTAIGVANSRGFNFVGTDETIRVTAALASHDMFLALGVPPLRGRAFVAEDDRPGAGRTVMLGEGIWRRVFGGRDSLVGETIQLSGEPYQVIGVMPAAFQYPARSTEVWIPLGLFAAEINRRGDHPGLYAVARRKPGVSHEAAVADMKAIAAQLAQEYPATNTGLSVSMQPLTERIFGQAQGALYLLLGAAGFVLLIAGANAANLQLARALGRSREFAVCAALGAGRGRIVRQLLAESLLLGVLGGAAGLATGLATIEALRSLLPANLPRIAEVGLNGPVLAFACATSLVASVAVGLVPAWQATKTDLRATLGQTPRAGGGAHAWRSWLIVGEFALTCTLLVGAGLMIRTLANLYRNDPGYAVDHLLAASWTVPGAAEAGPALVAQAQERLAVLPGASAVAMMQPIPLGGSSNQRGYYVESSGPMAPGRGPSAEYFRVSDNAFGTMQIALLAGRTFGPEDTPTTAKVAVVDTVFAEKNFPGQDAVGKRFAYGGPPPDESGWFRIIGVVEHIENFGPGQMTREQTYISYRQGMPPNVTFVIRSDTDPSVLAAPLRSAIREIAPDSPLYAIRTMTGLYEGSISTERLSVVLLGTFAGLALLLAAVGLYGMLAFLVGQRTREIGVRMALGASRGAVAGLVLRQGLKLTGLGLGLGLAASLGLTQLMKHLLYQTSVLDPLSFTAVALVLAVIGALACWLPARRAAKVDPMVALRSE